MDKPMTRSQSIQINPSRWTPTQQEAPCGEKGWTHRAGHVVRQAVDLSLHRKIAYRISSWLFEQFNPWNCITFLFTADARELIILPNKISRNSLPNRSEIHSNMTAIMRLHPVKRTLTWMMTMTMKRVTRVMRMVKRWTSMYNVQVASMYVCSVAMWWVSNMSIICIRCRYISLIRPCRSMESQPAVITFSIISLYSTNMSHSFTTHLNISVPALISRPLLTRNPQVACLSGFLHWCGWWRSDWSAGFENKPEPLENGWAASQISAFEPPTSGMNSVSTVDTEEK